MMVYAEDWNAYWSARQEKTGARFMNAVRLEIMSAEIYDYEGVIDARDLRPDDFTRYGLTVPEEVPRL